MRATRTVLVLTVVATSVAVAAPVLTLPAAAARPVTPVVRTVPLAATATGPVSMDAQSRSSSVTPGRHDPVRRLQTAQRPTERFSLVAVTWRRTEPGSAYAVQVRTRSDGRWTPWTELHQDRDAPNRGSSETDGGRDATAPLWAGPSDGVEVRVDVQRGAAPRDLSAVLVDPGRSPADAAVDQRPAASADAHVPRPTIYSRRHWGADESLRRHAPQYSDTITAAFVHHTAGTNSYRRADVPAIIRGIYAFHVKGRGWSDVGYNFFVDRFGRIWEGRYGGIDKPVLGAHTGGFNTRTFGVAVLGHFEAVGPNVATVQSIARVIAWRFAMYGPGIGRKATGRTRLTSAGGGTSRHSAGQRVTLYRISGHRDVGKTACPGEMLYRKLPWIRQLAAERMRKESTHGGTVG